MAWTAAGAIEAAKRAFFRSFFRLLVAFVALAEWVCIAWVLLSVGLRPPPALHVFAPLAIFQLNRRIVMRRRSDRRRRLDALVRAYVAFAFTSIFCALFLGLAGLGALAGRIVVPLVPATLGEPIARAYAWLVHAGFFTVAGLLAYGYVLGPRELAVSRVDIPVRGLPEPLVGLRIVHLSDLHVGQHLDVAELAEHVRRVNALQPDLVCVTGDLVDRAETCGLAFPTLAGLRARHGVLVTLGNHDFYAGAETVTEALRRLTPFTVLRDECVHLDVDGARLTVVGIDDLGRDWARGVLEHPALPSLAAAVPAGNLLIVLSHRPDCFAQAARLGAALMLSGHTHGGQLALPAWLGRRARNLAQFISRFDRGLFRDGDATLYVNRGLGFTGQKVRLFTPREIACLELTPA
ncbi:MAG: metallophosphoesterase [Deltaproteobacteria bacterium]|nr:MAG: metallophosphoesterase [Deltaproteobacteria bacterium]